MRCVRIINGPPRRGIIILFAEPKSLLVAKPEFIGQAKELLFADLQIILDSGCQLWQVSGWLCWWKTRKCLIMRRRRRWSAGWSASKFWQKKWRRGEEVSPRGVQQHFFHCYLLSIFFIYIRFHALSRPEEGPLLQLTVMLSHLWACQCEWTLW